MNTIEQARLESRLQNLEARVLKLEIDSNPPIPDSGGDQNITGHINEPVGESEPSSDQ